MVTNKQTCSTRNQSADFNQRAWKKKNLLLFVMKSALDCCSPERLSRRTACIVESANRILYQLMKAHFTFCRFTLLTIIRRPANMVQRNLLKTKLSLCLPIETGRVQSRCPSVFRPMFMEMVGSSCVLKKTKLTGMSVPLLYVRGVSVWCHQTCSSVFLILFIWHFT